MKRRSAKKAQRLIKEVDDVQRFSSAYFSTFKIRQDRIPQWQFLCLIIQSEGEELKSQNFRYSDAFEKLAKRWGRSKDPRYALETMLQECCNENGPLVSLKTPKGSAYKYKDQVIVFAPPFHKAVREYISVFARDVAPPNLVPENLNEHQRLQLFRLIMLFIRKDHWDAWDHTLHKVIRTTKHPHPGAWVEKASHNSSYWVILLTAWRKYLGDVSVWTDNDGFSRQILDIVGVREPADIGILLKELSGKTMEILLADKPKNPTYSLNPKLDAIFEEYTNQLPKLTEKLFSMISSALVSGLTASKSKQRTATTSENSESLP
jgi:hypothetical protein